MLRTMIVLLSFAAMAFSATADSLLAGSAKLFQGRQGLSLSFEAQMHSAATGENVTQKGSLLVGERNRFRLKAQGIEFYSDGINLWQFNVAQKQVLVKLLSDLENQFHPSEILFKYLQCKAKSVRSETWKGQKVHVLTLDPAHYKGQFRSMEVWLDPKNLSPVRLSTVDNLGNTAWYEVTAFQKIAPPADNQFVFVAPAGVDEIDMR